jgi:hypothetical protein
VRVRFSPEVVEHPPAWNHLDAVVGHLLDERHEWDIDDPLGLASSGWIASDAGGRAGKRNAEALQKSATAMMWKPRKDAITIVIDVHARPGSVVRFDEAERALSRPAYVVIENAESDGAFLNAMMYAFGRKRLLDAHTHGWWEFEHAGGYGEIEKRVRDIQARTVGPLRVLVLADSDVRYPGDRSATIIKIETFCRAESVPFCILRKRKIENYIPLPALKGLHPPSIGAYSALAPQQRDYFDLKKGFSPHPSVDPPNVAALYATVPRHVRTALEGGFGKDVWRSFIDNVDAFTAESVRTWCHSEPTEIERLLDSIESLL